MEVVTLTGNLLAEWTLDVLRLESGTTHRAESIGFQVGGKGINVSRILKHLGVETEAHGFASGPLARLCDEWLDQKRIRHRFHPLRQGVRPGMVIRESGRPDSAETTFLGLDLAIETEAWDAAIRSIAGLRPQWLAICGSIPGWQSGWLEPVKRFIEDNRIELCVDTYGPPLEDLVKLPVELVKVNRNELGRLLPEMADRSTLDLLAQISETSPVRNWIITNGPHPTIAAFENGELYEVEPARIEEVSAMGSGDTFLASLLHQALEKSDAPGMLKAASACATANAASPGIADFAMPVPSQYYPRVTKL